MLQNSYFGYPESNIIYYKSIKLTYILYILDNIRTVL